MRQFIATAGVAAVAGQFRRRAGVVAILAAVLAILRRQAIASRMSAPLGFSHDFRRTTFPSSTIFQTSDDCGVELFPPWKLPGLG